MVQLSVGTVSIWVGYVHAFIPTGGTHTLLVKSWVRHGYSILPVGIPIPNPFVLTRESGVSQ
jgi:hypothetical protein